VVQNPSLIFGHPNLYAAPGEVGYCVMDPGDVTASRQPSSIELKSKQMNRFVVVGRFSITYYSESY
jgi:hypothetical protein